MLYWEPAVAGDPVEHSRVRSGLYRRPGWTFGFGGLPMSVCEAARVLVVRITGMRVVEWRFPEGQHQNGQYAYMDQATHEVHSQSRLLVTRESNRAVVSHIAHSQLKRGVLKAP